MAAPREVSEEDLSLLEIFLMSERAPADCMQLSDLDGFLTGIVIGPERIAPEEWMPLVWNGEPEFETPAERAHILGIVLARHEEVLWTLTQTPEEFAPILWQDDDGEPSPRTGPRASSPRSACAPRRGRRSSSPRTTACCSRRSQHFGRTTSWKRNSTMPRRSGCAPRRPSSCLPP
jgi:hypothetical protein